jgi:hypothetical protein
MVMVLVLVVLWDARGFFRIPLGVDVGGEDKTGLEN